jgi:hypothetical protein
LTVSAQLTPLADDVGRTLNVYVAVVIPRFGITLMRNGQNWAPLSLPLPVAFQTVGSAGPLQVPVVSGLDTIAVPLTGAKVIVGYGRDDSDFLNGKYRVVYQFP